MKISIIIPVYNVAPYIAACLHSVMRQTCEHTLECILVDDCGTDDSMMVVEQMLDTYQGPVTFQVVHHKQNRGLSAARNTGLSQVTGDYVCFLDSDDEMTQDSISLLAAPLQREHYDMTIGECRIEGGTIPGVALQLQDGMVLRDREIIRSYRQQQWYMMSVNKLYRLEFLRSHGLSFKEGILHEDELWSFQIACVARSMTIVAHDTYIYKLRQGSITVNTFSERQMTSLNTILAEMTDYADSLCLDMDPDVHHIIRNFQLAVLSRVARQAPKALEAVYRRQRQSMQSSWLNALLMNGSDIRKQLRDFHLALPIPLAIWYLKPLLRYYQKLSAE